MSRGMRAPALVAGLAGVALGCGGSQQPIDDTGVGTEPVLPMIVTRHVTALEASDEAASSNLERHLLRISFARGVSSDDLVAQYFERANELKAVVTAELAVEARGTRDDGSRYLCRMALEPEAKTDVIDHPEEQREVEVKRPFVVAGCVTTDALFCDRTFMTGVVVSKETEVTPAWTEHRVHRGFRASEPACAPLPPDDAEPDAAPYRIVGTIYTPRTTR